MTLKKEKTIYDIAEVLKVSPATVSRGLKDHPSISAKTKKKILKKAEEFGYRSNTFASNLRRQQSNTIGVIVPKLHSYFMSSAIAGIEKIVNDSGYNLIISQSLELSAKEVANADTMYNSRVDGLIVSLAGETENTDHFKKFTDKDIPVVFFDRIDMNAIYSSFIINNFQAGYQATNHLIEQGCKKIVHVAGNIKRNVYKERMEGYKQALKDANIDIHEDNIIFDKLDIQGGLRTASVIAERNSGIDGVFVANDSCAAGCILGLKKGGIRVPEDVAVVGFNNDEICELVEPNITTINYSGREMGEIVAKSLINHLKGQMNVKMANQVVMKSDLIVRASSKKTRDRKN